MALGGEDVTPHLEGISVENEYVVNSYSWTWMEHSDAPSNGTGPRFAIATYSKDDD